MRIDIKKVLCPVDFSESSDHALQYARAFSESYGSRLVMLHVIEVPHLPSYSTFGIPEIYYPVEDIQKQCEESMDELVKKYSSEKYEISGEVVVGTAFVEIVQKAKKEDFDLIVLGTHGRSGLRHIIIGSVAEKVVRKAPCPVLSVKHPEHEFVMP